MAADNNLTLGRGELWFAKYATGTQVPGGERYIGNSPEFNATIESETLDHFSSDHGVKEKDASVPLSTNRSGSFITDNIDPENVALFFFGKKEIFNVTAGSVSAEQINAVSPGLTYQLGMTLTNPSGARELNVTTAPIVKDDTTPTAVTFVAGTDYKIDPVLGRLTVIDGGAITEGKNLRVDYATKAVKRSRIISGSTAIEGALRYIAYNPAGAQLDWYMPYVQLSPNGDYALKGDEWQQIPFNVAILKKTGLEAIYIDGRAYV
jgi:hypothetical protein